LISLIETGGALLSPLAVAPALRVKANFVF
jgi:hypothetical protein